MTEMRSFISIISKEPLKVREPNFVALWVLLNFTGERCQKKTSRIRPML